MTDTQAPRSVGENVREREATEAAPHIAKARETGKPVVFIAGDGCEVTCLPDGTTLFNVADWW